MNTKIFYSFVIYRKEMFVKLMIFAIIGLSLLYLTNHFIGNRFLSFFFLIITVVPFIFISRLFKFFRKKAVILFKENLIQLTLQNSNSEIVYDFEYYLSEIKSYTIQFPNYRFASIKLNLKNGKSAEYTFQKQMQDDTQESIDKILKQLHYTIENYNKNLVATEKILFKPSFFATKSGLFTIIGLCFLFIIAIFLHILFHQIDSFPIVLLFGFMIIIQLIFKRIADINFYKMWANFNLNDD